MTPTLLANEKRLFMPDSTTNTQRESFDPNRSQYGLMTPLSMRWNTCGAVPLEITLVMIQAASFCDRNSPCLSTSQMSGNISLSITCWICSALPAVILLSVHADSLTMLFFGFFSNFFSCGKTPALNTISVYRKLAISIRIWSIPREMTFSSQKIFFLDLFIVPGYHFQ